MPIAAGNGCKGSVQSGTSATTNSVNTAASGSTLYAQVAYTTGQSFTGVSDNKGNTYTEIGSALTINGDWVLREYYCENGVGGSAHTFTVSGGTGTWVIAACEITGGKTSGILDPTPPAGAVDTSSPFTSNNITTNQAAVLLLAGFTHDGTGDPITHTPGSSFTKVSGAEEQNGSTLWPLAIAGRVVSSTGTYSSDWTVSGSSPGNTGIRISAFEEGGASPPSIGSLSPVSKVEDGAAFTLTVNGANFVSGAVVQWAGSDRTTTFVSAAQLTATINAADIVTPGVYAITVRNPDTQVSGALNFSVDPTPTALARSRADWLGVPFGSRGWLGAAASSGADLAGAAVAAAAAAGALTVAKSLAGGATGGASAAAGLSIIKPIAGAATGSGAAAGALSKVATLVGAAVGGVTAAGALSISIPLAGAAVAAVQSSGDLTVSGGGSQALEGGASAAGGLAVGKPIAGAGIGGASAAGTLSLGIGLNGAAVAAAVATGSLLKQVLLQGAATGGAQASAELAGGASLAGAAGAGASATGVLSITVRLAAGATASGSAAVTMTLSVPLSAAALAAAQSGGALAIALNLSAAAVAAAQSGGALTVTSTVLLQGAAQASATATGELASIVIFTVDARRTVRAAARTLAAARATSYVAAQRRRAFTATA